MGFRELAATLPPEWQTVGDAEVDRRGLVGALRAAQQAPATKLIYFVHHVGQYGHELRYDRDSGRYAVDLASLTPAGRQLAETISTTVNGFLVVEYGRTRGAVEDAMIARMTPERAANFRAVADPIDRDGHERSRWTFGSFSPGRGVSGIPNRLHGPLPDSPEFFLDRTALDMKLGGWLLVGESESRMDSLHGVEAQPWRA